MTIVITTDETLDPEQSTVTINGNKYNEFKNLNLVIAKDKNGSLTIEHESGYIEAYKSSGN